MGKALTLALVFLATAVFSKTIPEGAGADSAPSPKTRNRFALIIGADYGGKERARLKYAVSDARDFADVMRTLGGVEASRCLLLIQPKPEAVRNAGAKLRQLIGASPRAASGVEIIVYYSGHSDDKGLRLGNEVLSYAEFRALLDGLPADVRIAIVDGCSSGSLIRRKGGALQPALAVDAVSRSRGYAFLTSAAADEAAQESNRLESSFFTHHLISGLRGAADANANRLVTLTEAYDYAFRETLRQSERTGYGPQHAGYDIQLQGTGEVVLTDISRVSAWLRLGRELEGRVFVRDARGKLVAEVAKEAGRTDEIGIEPGEYTLVMQKGGRVYRWETDVSDGATVEAGPAAFSQVSLESSAARGVFDEADAGTVAYLHKPLNLGIIPDFSMNGNRSRRISNNVSANLFFNDIASLKGLQLGLVWNRLRDEGRGIQFATLASWNDGDFSGMQFAGAFNFNEGEFRGIQQSYFMNRADGNFTGIQQCLIGVNYARGDASFFQMGMIGNATLGRMEGAQFSAVNFADRLVGGQGGFANWTREGDGLQGAVGFNVAGGFRGIQAGIVNLAGSVHGGQVGLINAGGRVRGAQLGLLNLADSVEGISLSPFGYSRKGRFAVDALWDDGRMQVGISHGNRRLYNLFTLTPASLVERLPERMGMGVGVRQDLGRFFASSDAGAEHRAVAAAPDENALRLRLTAGASPLPHLSLIGGASLHALLGGNRTWTGLFAGLRVDK
jgi:hypothetical protein